MRTTLAPNAMFLQGLGRRMVFNVADNGTASNIFLLPSVGIFIPEFVRFQVNTSVAVANRRPLCVFIVEGSSGLQSNGVGTFPASTIFLAHCARYYGTLVSGTNSTFLPMPEITMAQNSSIQVTLESGQAGDTITALNIVGWQYGLA